MRIFILALLIMGEAAEASTYTFYYNDPSGLKVVVNADTKAAAYPKAAKLCFQALTGGKFPGEERGLDIIDYCSNPIRFTVREF